MSNNERKEVLERLLAERTQDAEDAYSRNLEQRLLKQGRLPRTKTALDKTSSLEEK